jgi:hypothetical protein
MGLIARLWGRKDAAEAEEMPPLLAGMGVVDPISLDRFCGDEETRPYLHQPFSYGEYTYATDGSIIVRVPRRDDVAGRDPTEPPTLGGVEALFFAAEGRTFGPLPEYETLPEKPGVMEPHSDCEGKGCGACEETGEIERGYRAETARFPVHDVAAYYLDLIRSLPNLSVAFGKPLWKADLPLGRKPPADHAIAFRFDGGCGLLMPLQREESEAGEAA